MHRSSSTPRGFARCDLVATIGTTALLCSLVLPSVANVHTTDRRADSMANLRALGGHHACYSADWNDRQWTAVPDDLGAFQGHNGYVNENACMSWMTLGWGETSSGQIRSYEYRLGCPPLSNGSAGNLMVHVPLSFGWGEDVNAYRFINCRALHEYADGRFYDPVYYAPGDWGYERLEPKFASPLEYAIGEFPDNVPASYILSPAAMYHPDVLRQPVDGGYQFPGDWGSAGAFADSYRSPAASQVRYGALKSRLMERNWIDAPPSASHPTYRDPLLERPPGPAIDYSWMFNHGRDATVLALFFDGSISPQNAGRVAKADARVRAQSGGEQTLWSRDTTFGSDGLHGQHAVDGIRVSHHVLTTEGILGRDRLADTGTKEDQR